MKKAILLIAGIFVLTVTWGVIYNNSLVAVDKMISKEEIKWLTFDQAIELNKKNPRKIMVDVYTDWCGWCKKLDASTFKHPVIAKYVNEKYYAVKFNAESKDPVVLKNHTFVNPNPQSKNSTHQLAAAMLNNRLSYPTTVFFDEEFNLLSPVPGYQDASTMEVIINYFGSESYKNQKFDDYKSTFSSEIK